MNVCGMFLLCFLISSLQKFEGLSWRITHSFPKIIHYGKGFTKEEVMLLSIQDSSLQLNVINISQGTCTQSYPVQSSTFSFSALRDVHRGIDWMSLGIF